MITLVPPDFSPLIQVLILINGIDPRGINEIFTSFSFVTFCYLLGFTLIFNNRYFSRNSEFVFLFQCLKYQLLTAMIEFWYCHSIFFNWGSRTFVCSTIGSESNEAIQDCKLWIVFCMFWIKNNTSPIFSRTMNKQYGWRNIY